MSTLKFQQKTNAHVPRGNQFYHHTSDFKKTFQVKVHLFILVFPTNPLCGLNLFACAIFIKTTQSINCCVAELNAVSPSRPVGLLYGIAFALSRCAHRVVPLVRSHVFCLCHQRLVPGGKFHYNDRLRDIKTTALIVGRTSSIDVLVETRRGDLIKMDCMKNTLE